MSWYLTIRKKSSAENSVNTSYDITGFRQDASVGVGPFEYVLDKSILSNYYTKILPLIAESSARYRSQAATLDNPEVNKSRVILADLGKSLYDALHPDLRAAIKNAKSIHLFTDELLIPWQLLHDGEKFLCLNVPFGVSTIHKSNLPETDSKIIGKLRILFLIDTVGDLPQSKMEVQKIISLLSTKNNIEWRVIEGSEASYGEVRTLLLREHFDIIHVATHTKFNQESSKDSGIVMNEGMLNTHDIFHSIKGDAPWLVFINACESSMLNHTKNYDESSGLALSFLSAGASTYIGTNALISDWSASEIAVNFYLNLINGATLGESMKNAKLNIYNNYPYDLSWAAFILYGNPNQKIIFDERNIEAEVRRYLSTNRIFIYSKCAKDLNISLSSLREIISKIKMEANKSIPEKSKIPYGVTEQEKEKTSSDSTHDLIKNRESDTLEFKGSLITGTKSKHNKEPLEPKLLKKKLEKEVAVAVAGFMNNKGGTLLIGVSDDHVALGLANDYGTLNPKEQNNDGFERYLKQKITNYTNNNKLVMEHLKVSFHDIEGKEICKVIVSPVQEPIYIHDENRVECYVRNGNETPQYKTDEFVNYCSRHFHQEKKSDTGN